MKYNIKVSILPNVYLKSDDTFDKDKALMLSGKIAGVCYDEEGFDHLMNEDESKTLRRIKRTIENGHHSVYDHIMISFNMQNIPKMLAMIINNEHEYTTSEKSLRYTPVVRDFNSNITIREESLYHKWMGVYINKIKEKYGNFYNDKQIRKLAQENARYLISVFAPTQMIYTTSLRQINYIASFMTDYIVNAKTDNKFEKDLTDAMSELLVELKRLNILDERLMSNNKHRKLSIFGSDINKNPDIFANVYSTTYKGSYAQYAQIQRHRTLDYQLERMNNKEYYVPLIIRDDNYLVEEWYKDMNIVKDITPQGELVNIIEMGTYDNFILKCKERLCSAVQLETMLQTRETLLKYRDALKDSNSYLYFDIENYTKGARCTFPGYECTEKCEFKEGITLTRKI